MQQVYPNWEKKLKVVLDCIISICNLNRTFAFLFLWWSTFVLWPAFKNNKVLFATVAHFCDVRVGLLSKWHLAWVIWNDNYGNLFCKSATLFNRAFSFFYRLCDRSAVLIMIRRYFFSFVSNCSLKSKEDPMPCFFDVFWCVWLCLFFYRVIFRGI